MSSLLGLANYYSDHTEDEADDTSNQNDAQRSPPSDDSNKVEAVEAAAGRVGRGGGDPDEDSNSQFGEPLGIDGGSMRAGVLRASSFDAPAPPSKEQKQFFMPLPSPLVRLDNASPSHATSPFMTHEPPNDEPGDAGVDCGEEEGEADGSEENEGDGDIIKPEYRDMLPPEATGQANPQLQAKIAKFLDTMQGDFTKSIKGKKDYGNPAVLAQICRYCTVDDKGTNYPDDRMVHPSVYDTKDFHDSLMADFRKAKRPEEAAKAQVAAQAQAAVQAQVAAQSQAAAQVQAQAAAAAAVASAAAAAPPQIRPAVDPATLAAAGAAAALPAVGTVRKRVNKWGSAPTAASALPFMGRPGQMANTPQAAAVAAAAAAATAAAAGAAAKAGGRVGFSVDPVATAARAGQAALLNAQAQAAKEAQQRAEAIARVQMITNRLGKAAQDQSLKDQPPKKPRLS